MCAPYVHKTPLGFTLVGKMCELPESSDQRRATICRMQTQNAMISLEEVEFPRIDGILPAKNRSYNFDVLETCPDDNKQGFSKDNKTFLRIMIEGETVVESCRLSYPLPQKQVSQTTEMSSIDEVQALSGISRSHRRSSML